MRLSIAPDFRDLPARSLDVHVDGIPLVTASRSDWQCIGELYARSPFSRDSSSYVLSDDSTAPEAPQPVEVFARVRLSTSGRVCGASHLDYAELRMVPPLVMDVFVIAMPLCTVQVDTGKVDRYPFPACRTGNPLAGSLWQSG